MTNEEMPPEPMNQDPDLEDTKDRTNQATMDPDRGAGSTDQPPPPTPLFLAYCEVDGEWVVALTPPGGTPTKADGATVSVGSRIVMTLKNDDSNNIDVLLSMSSGLGSAFTSAQNDRLRARQIGPNKSDTSTKDVTGGSLTIQIATLVSGDPKIQLATDKSTPTVIETRWNGEYWVITNEGTNGIIVDPEETYYVNQQESDDVWLNATDGTLTSPGDESICAIFEKEEEEERNTTESWADVLQYGQLTSSGNTFDGDCTLESQPTTYTINLYDSLTSATINLTKDS